MDVEMIKVKRERSDVQVAIEKVAREVAGLKTEDRRLQDVAENLSECLATLVEI